MEERKVTMVEFDEVVKGALKKLIDDKEIDGMAKVMMPLMGTMFASKMRFTLFGEDKEKSITEEEFDKAIKTVIDEMMNDEELEGMLKVIVPLAGSSFAILISKNLFGESEEK